MMKKILNTCSWPKFSLYYTLLGRKHRFFKGEHPIFKEKQTFHKKGTVLIRLPLLFLEGEDAQVFREKLPHPKVNGALVFR